MPNVCLPPKVADKFRAAFVDGKLNPEKLMNMSSEERHAYFEQFSDKASAKTINSLFESKLLLKNQQAGMVTWAKSVTGLSTNARKDILARIANMKQVLDPGEKEQFLKDLAETRLGVGVSRTEAKTIADMSQQVESAATKRLPDGNWKSDADRMAYGHAAVRMTNYVNELKVASDKLRLSELRHNPLGTGAKVLDRVAGNAKAISASLDDSAIFRQGWKTLWTHPQIWQKNARASFSNIAKSFGGKEIADEVNADIISRPNYQRMVKAKLAVGNLEEAFPTTLPEKVPLLGRAYKATEQAYTAFVQKTRADVFDKYLDIAQKTGININDETELKAIGHLVNSLTGRGGLGAAEPVANKINNVFFSPRFLKSNLDLLTQPLGAGGAKTAFARQQAAKNLIKVVAGTGAILGIAHALDPNAVQLDPRSSDFGKIKAGDTRFDVSGGESSIITLASRVFTASSKSSTTGQVTKLNSGKYGSQNIFDILTDFATNKTSPAASIIVDILKGQDHQGNKPTVGGELKQSFSPLGIQTATESASDPHSANTLLTVIADGLGIAANTYGQSQGGLLKSTSKSVTAFHQKIGDTAFKQAAAEYDKRLNDFTQSTVVKPEYKVLSSADQQALFTKEKAKIQAQIMSKYHFQYQREKSQHSSYSNLLQ